MTDLQVRIFPAGERFWYYSRRAAVRRYRLVVRRTEDGAGLQLVEVGPGEEVEQTGGRLSVLQLASLTASSLAGGWSASKEHIKVMQFRI